MEVNTHTHTHTHTPPPTPHFIFPHPKFTLPPKLKTKIKEKTKINKHHRKTNGLHCEVKIHQSELEAPCPVEKLGIHIQGSDFNARPVIPLVYNEEVAVKAILWNGHCYGGTDALTNILYNSLAFFNRHGGGNVCGSLDESEPAFSDLRQLEEYSLVGMVFSLQQVRPHSSKGETIWCLLMGDLPVKRASTMEIPVLCGAFGDVVAPALCRFHRGWGFGKEKL